MPSSWLWRALTRRKVVDLDAARPSAASASTSTEGGASSSSSPLARVLTTFDLTALGVGSTLGVGVYVLAGSVARDFAGPAVIISFFVAAVASIFAGLCYAEFGARVPLAGSAYIYSYISIGEFMAFVIGWNLIMEYVIGCASVARGLSNYLDQLVDNAMQESFQSVAHLHVDFLSPYIDFFAFGISFLLSVVLAFGVKESMSLNNLFTTVNMAVVLFVIVAGSFKADIANWQIEKSSLPPNVHGGQGGFFPFGVMGVLRGAATCFYGFIGFDCVATTGEEVKNPQRAIPTAIIVSLIIIFLSYFGVSAVLTLMWPYYLQDADAPLPYVFNQIDWPVAQWTVAIGGIFGLFASLFGAMYPLPRVIYAMANDGLIFKFLGEVHPKYKTPLVGTLLAGIITGLMAALFKLQQLVNMLSIGTLVAYTIVAACVLLLRYKYVICEPGDVQNYEEAVSLLSDSEKLDDIYRYHESDDMHLTEYKETTNLMSLKEKPTISRVFLQLFNSNGLRSPTAVTSRLVGILVLIFCGLSVALGLCLVRMEYELVYGHWGPLALVCVISSLLFLVVLSIALQPSSSRELAFKVPLVPVIPALSILLNIYLILMLDLYTWIRFLIWMAVGVGVYFIALACRSFKWCGSPPVLQSSSALSPQTPASITKPSGKNHGPEITTAGLSEPSQTNWEALSEITEVPEREVSVPSSENKRSYMVQGNHDRDLTPAVVVSVASVSPVISIGADIQSVPLHQQNFILNKCSLAQGFENNAFLEDNCVKENLQAFICKDLVVADCDIFDEDGDDDYDDISITEVTNDLLSLTYENQLPNENMSKHFQLKSLTSPGDSDIEQASLRSGEISILSSAFNEVETIPSINIEHILLNLENDGTEDDVRSLYPDVVVISSSEEDIDSRGSSVFGNSVICADIDPQSTYDIIRPEKYPVEAADILNENSLKDSIKFSTNEKVETSESSDVSSLPCVQNLILECHNKTSDLGCDEFSSPLKNTSFVEKLEKIIEAQSVELDRFVIPGEMKVLSKEKSISCQSRLDMQPDSFLDNCMPSLTHEAQEIPLQEFPSNRALTTVEGKPKVDPDASKNIDGREDINHGVVSDIRAKLERIFSMGMASSTVSPILQSNPVEFPVARHHEENNSVTAKNVHESKLVKSSDGIGERSVNDLAERSEVSVQMDEARRHMVDVLGTLRLRNLGQLGKT